MKRSNIHSHYEMVRKNSGKTTPCPKVYDLCKVVDPYLRLRLYTGQGTTELQRRGSVHIFLPVRRYIYTRLSALLVHMITSITDHRTKSVGFFTVQKDGKLQLPRLLGLVWVWLNHIIFAFHHTPVTTLNLLFHFFSLFFLSLASFPRSIRLFFLCLQPPSDHFLTRAIFSVYVYTHSRPFFFLSPKKRSSFEFFPHSFSLESCPLPKQKEMIVP